MNLMTIISICVLLITAFVLISCAAYYSVYYDENHYELSEIENGVYAIYCTVSSNVPAQNYEMVTLCCDGNIMTLKGSVNISYTNNSPYVIIKDYNIVNRDEIYIHIPEGTMKIQESVGV